MIKSYKKNKKTYYEVFVKGRDKLGKQVARRKKGIPSITKARNLEIDFINEIRGEFSQARPRTWEEWHDECLDRMRLTYKQSTVMGYEGSLTKWLPQSWCEKKINEITKKDVYRLIFNDLSEMMASPHTQKKVLKKIARLLEMALEEGLIARNPARGITVSTPAPEKKVLNSNEAAMLLKEARDSGHRFYYHWAFALFTGMRNGEMYALEWKDVDLETGLISVTRQWTSKDGLHQTKSNSHRVVPINRELKTLLLELKKQGPFREKLKGETTVLKDLVLPRLREWVNGEQAKALSEFCQAIKVTPIKFHDLRATFITNMLSQGVPLVKVMTIVGHSRMSTTDEYLRLAGVDIKKGTTDKLGYTLPKKEQSNVLKLVNTEH